MKLKTHPHKSDVLTLTVEDLRRIADGETLQVSALVIELEKADIVRYVWASSETGRAEGDLRCVTEPPNLRLVLCGKSGELKSAEVLVR